MTEGRDNILRESKRILSKLQLLSVFFADEIILKIYLRSQVIHQLFETNEELDINNLELFHIQFTNSVIDLLRNIKKSNEKKVSLLMDEIRLNEELIEKMRTTGFSEASYRLEIPRQSLKMKRSLKQLYTVLSDGTSDYPFSKNINAFSVRYAAEYYYSIPADLLAMLTKYEASEVYSNVHAIIQKKLMGLLCKHDFNAVFFCGLVAGSLIMEVYRIGETETYFVFYPSRNLLLLCDTVELEHIRQNAAGKQDNIIPDLMNRNDQLQSHMAVTKVYLPNEVKTVLTEHYHKITDINFLQSLTNFDAQVNILKTMLNTKII